MIFTVQKVDFVEEVENLGMTFVKDKSPNPSLMEILDDKKKSVFEKLIAIIFKTIYGIVTFFYITIYYYFLPLFIILIVFDYGRPLEIVPIVS